MIQRMGVGYGRFAPQFLRDDGVRTATTNERAILSALRRGGPKTRAQLSRALDLTEQSITRLIEPLVRRGLVVEDRPVVSGRGKPGAPLRLDARAAHAVGVSVMTDAVAAAIMDLSGAVLARREIRLQDTAPPSAFRKILALAQALENEVGAAPERRLGFGVAVTGYFVGDGAQVNPPPGLDAWALSPLDRLLSDAFAGPVWIENDGAAAAIGEAMIGAGLRYDSLAYLYFSAGFGGGVILNGEPMRGVNGNAGEFASILPSDWFQPNLTQLLRMIQEPGGGPATIAEMLAAFPSDSPAVARWVAAAVPSLNLIVSAISGVLDTQAIVLGGRLPTPLAEALASRLSFTNPERRGRRRPVPTIMASPIAGDVSAIGAAALPLRAAFF